jgi:hypothetical protein
MRYVAVNWHDEGLESFYGDDNNGFIYGVYAYDEDDDSPIDVSWFKTEEIRNKALEESK